MVLVLIGEAYMGSKKWQSDETIPVLDSKSLILKEWLNSIKAEYCIRKKTYWITNTKENLQQ